YITVWGFIFLISLSAVCYTTKSLSQFSPLFWKGSSHKPMSNFLMRSFLHIQDMLRGYVLAFPAPPNLYNSYCFICSVILQYIRFLFNSKVFFNNILIYLFTANINLYN